MFHRSVIVALLIALQAAVVIVAMIHFSGSFVYLYWIFLGLSVLAVLVIVSRQTDPGYKIAWIILILIFPILGWLFYVFCGGNRLSGRVRRKMQGMDRKLTEVLDQEGK